MSWRPARRLEGVERTAIRRVFDAAPAGAINLGLGQPDLPTPSLVSLAGIEAIVERRTGYTTTAGTTRLREAIAARYSRLCDGAQEVLVTVGSQEALFVSCLGLLDPGDELLYPDPGYPAYPVVARLVGARPVPYALRSERGFRLEPRELERRLSPRTRVAILCSPSNPTGAIPERDELEEVTTLLARRNVSWISDEIYAAFDYEGRGISPAELAPGGGLVISGLSKSTSMTGWRLGWVLGPERLVEPLVAAHQYLVTCAPSISQEAAIAALSEAGHEQQRRMVRRFRRRRETMARALEGVPGIHYRLPDGAFYFFVDVSSHGGGDAVAQRLLQRRRVITIPGGAFGEGGRAYLRLSYAAAEEEIVEGVARMARELAAR